MTETNKKNYPTGWHFKSEFVDIDGNVYHKGKEQPHLKDTLPVSILQNKKGEYVYPPGYQPIETVKTPQQTEEVKPKESIEKIDLTETEEIKQPEKSIEKDAIDELRRQLAELSAKFTNQTAVQTPAGETKYVIAKEEKEKKFGDGVRSVTKEDFLEKNVTFIKSGKGFLLSVYFKNGGEVLAPYNKPIYFAYCSSDIKEDGDASKMLHLCEYTTNSQKEVEFIRNSPLYGVTIFENVDKVIKIDNKMTAKLESVALNIGGMTNDQVFLNALTYGLDRNKGVDALKKELMVIKIQSMLEEEEKIFTERSKQMQKELFSVKE